MVEEKEEVKQIDFDKFVEKILKFKQEKNGQERGEG